ncbi:hypothetical protein Hanom_Chr02g00103671 [Helianthus anomalus]
MCGGEGGYSTVLPTAEVIAPRRPPPSKPESGGKSATVGALGTSKTRTRHLRVRMRAGGHLADTQWLILIMCDQYVFRISIMFLFISISSVFINRFFINLVALQEQKNASTSVGLDCPVGESSSYKCIPAERTEENHPSFNLNDQIAPLEFMWKVVSKQLLTLNINSYQAFLRIKWGRMKTQICRFTSRR